MSTAIPKNKASFHIEEVAVATSGRILVEGPQSVCGVSTDSRTVGADNLFVALVGERFDDHAHLAEARQKGAKAAIVSEVVEAPPGLSLILVEDTTKALGALARAHRRRWAARSPGRRRTVVAITGSAGKTTTRRAVAALLSELGASVHASTGNLNNAVGVPMVLLGLTDEHDTAVIEIGTSSRGEIAYGAAIAEPDISLITLVALAHAEGIGSLRDVASEKGELFAALGRSGVAIANGDDPHARAALLRSSASRWVLYGTCEDADVRVTESETLGINAGRLALSLRGPVRYAPLAREDLPTAPASLIVETPLLGRAGAFATAAAVAVGCVLLPERLSSTSVVQAFSRLEDISGRLVPRRLANDTVVLDDSYNANRASMVASIALAKDVAAKLGRRLLLILGEMRELGPYAAEEHEAVARAAIEASPAHIVSVGLGAAVISTTAHHAGVPATHVADAAEASEQLSQILLPGDVVLIKGSRGVGLDRVVDALAASGAKGIAR